MDNLVKCVTRSWYSDANRADWRVGRRPRREDGLWVARDAGRDALVGVLLEIPALLGGRELASDRADTLAEGPRDRLDGGLLVE